MIMLMLCGGFVVVLMLSNLFSYNKGYNRACGEITFGLTNGFVEEGEDDE